MCERYKINFYNGELSGLSNSDLDFIIKLAGDFPVGNRDGKCKQVKDDKHKTLQYYRGPTAIDNNLRNLSRNQYTWRDIVTNWSNGFYFNYPNYLKNRFLYFTNECIPERIYIERLREENKLLDIIYKAPSFKKEVKTDIAQYTEHVVDGSTIVHLVPVRHYNTQRYITMKEFMDSAPIPQQVLFWKMVANIIQKGWNDNKTYPFISYNGSSNFFRLSISYTNISQQ